MFELNANTLAPLCFALVYGPATYWRSRQQGVPISPALSAAVTTTIEYVVIAILYGFALNRLGLAWNSLAGIGLGTVFGLAGALLFLAFQKWRHRQRHWR